MSQPATQIAKKRTSTLIKENARYVRKTGFDRPLIADELTRRAHEGDKEAAEYCMAPWASAAEQTGGAA